jgi:putative DNA primase/helicase
MMLACNHLPTIHGTDHGIWRRINVVLFSHRVTEIDRKLKDKLLAERDGIFTFFVLGSVAYWEHGFDEPAVVAKASSKYRHDMDTFQQWMDECVVHVDDLKAMLEPARLYQNYVAWCKDNDAAPKNKKAFNDVMEKRGFVKGLHPSTRRAVFKGLRWRAAQDDVATPVDCEGCEEDAFAA